MDLAHSLSSRATAIIGSMGTLSSWGLASAHEIASISVAVITILVLVPTGIKNWRNLWGEKKNDESKSDGE